MANWCYNYVKCTGSAEDIAKFKKTLWEGIDHISTYKQVTNLGIEVQEGYFFNIFINTHGETWITFYYETKCTPNLLDIAELCKSYNLKAKCEYNECCMQIYGKAIIDSDGSIHDEPVPSDFLDLIEYNYDTGMYEYGGKEYETEEEIIDDQYEKWKLANAIN